MSYSWKRHAFEAEQSNLLHVSRILLTCFGDSKLLLILANHGHAAQAGLQGLRTEEFAGEDSGQLGPSLDPLV